jgi:lipoate-protein ligase B
VNKGDKEFEAITLHGIGKSIEYDFLNISRGKEFLQELFQKLK